MASIITESIWGKRKPGAAPEQTKKLGAIASVRLTKWTAGVSEVLEDAVATEEPLSILLGEELVTTSMRTPGDDHRLALGFLLTDGWIRGVEDLSSLGHCDAGGHNYANTLVAVPAPGHTALTDPAVRGSRRGTSNSACGVCGRENIEQLLELCRPLTNQVQVDVTELLSLVKSLPLQQSAFAQTGGMHAAGTAISGSPLGRVFEDVGRHNAVDKAIGDCLLTKTEPDILVVSSRAGFEIVQKACVARIPIVVTISAPTSLAVETARALNLTLVGFARKDSLNVYSGAGRVWHRGQRLAISGEV